MVWLPIGSTPILSQPASEWLAANATASAKHVDPDIGVAILAASNVWTAAFAEYGRIDRILPSQMIENGLRPRQIVTRQALENPAAIVGSTGGCTNAGLAENPKGTRCSRPIST
jgi:hypothetical protein